MDLVTPQIGLMFWTTLVFLILVFLLKKLAWKPILGAVKDREKSINDALNAAEEAKKEMAALNASNEALLKEAREERDNMLKAAREAKEQIMAEAKAQAKVEAEKIMTSARATIDTEKKAAMAEIKNQVATLSLEVAEKVLRTELATDEKQSALVTKYVDEINLN